MNFCVWWMEDKAMYVNYFWFTFYYVLQDVLLAIATYKMTLKTFTCDTLPLTLLSLESLPMPLKGFKSGKIWNVLKSSWLSFPNYMRSHLLRVVAQVWAKQTKNVQQNFAVFSLSNWIYSGIFCSTLWFGTSSMDDMLKEGELMLSTFLCQHAIIALHKALNKL